MERTLNVAMIGGGFMGRAHSNAWKKVNTFFDAPYRVNLKVMVGSRSPLDEFAKKWGYEEVSYDWREVVKRPDIDIVSIGTPNDTHEEIAMEAARHGKHIVCEKPCALSYAACLRMAKAADDAGVTHYLNHNYRRVPAIAYAKQLIDEGRLGTIFHWRGAYLQDWIIDPDFPRTWHLDASRAGAGTLFDLGSHAVDLALFLVGEVDKIMSMHKTFIEERPLPGKNAATFSKGDGSGEKVMAKVDVDDAASMLMTFKNGAMGSIDLSRFATGRKNHNDFEIYGSKGAIAFNFERMNELEFLDATQPLAEQGYRRILCTEGEHPYLSAWWPCGHLIGYEHTFVNAFYDFLVAIDEGTGIHPNFHDGAKIMRVLEASKKSAESGRVVSVDEIV